MNDSEKRRDLINQMQSLAQKNSTETALFHQAAAEKLGLGITDLKAVSALLQEGPMTAGQLAKRLNLTTGAVSNVIDRLEKEKFVHRIPDTKDRRKVIVSVNKEKLSSTNNIYRSMGEAFEKLLETYSIEELKFLVKFYHSTIELTKLEIAKLISSWR
ncbi:MarR family winged helix-turn-helix transcriptional regulator [Lederbergia citri]|uniref:MarR family transcriptional regulator n=1 Tax=Lederbergia citri TaxID=2833580 RepID=A0A942TAI9_9BACI|nr:MarR family transcriptional regulator [Lederbergia citri]MBS4194170.1 MarR family transcriptional regulator [Lederbergia citri]